MDDSYLKVGIQVSKFTEAIKNKRSKVKGNDAYDKIVNFVF